MDRKFISCNFVCWLVIMLLAACQNSDKVASNDPMSKYLELSMEERRSPQNATGSFLTAEGLQVSLFAAEPLVVNPTNMDIDHQGRVWVLESPNYGLPNQEKNPQGGRITILEDTDGDGVADISTLFYQGPDVDTALGIAVLGNKVYVTRSPHLLVFTDNNGDDIPDSKEIVLTGMGKPGDHSSHALVFGPDGKFDWNMGN